MNQVFTCYTFKQSDYPWKIKKITFFLEITKKYTMFCIKDKKKEELYIRHNKLIYFINGGIWTVLTYILWINKWVFNN